MEYLPRIERQIDTLVNLIAAHSTRPVLLNDVMSWFAFDIMGEFLFNESFGMMESSRWHPAIVQQRGALALLAPLSDAIWLVRLSFYFGSLFGGFGKVKEWNAMVEFGDQAMQRRMKVGLEDLATRDSNGLTLTQDGRKGARHCGMVHQRV